MSPVTIVFLLFGIKLVRVRIPKPCFIKDVLHQVLFSGDYDIPLEILQLMRQGQYKPHHLWFLSPNRPFPIHDISRVPSRAELPGLDLMCSFEAVTLDVAGSLLPSDGSCLNVVIEEPSLISDIPEGDENRYLSREVVLFLNKHNAEIMTIGCTVCLEAWLFREVYGSRH
ncbi:hypothetical protein PM082_016080 [Marasmius tenuissimus]|nr:hypothetical protein PM082_016080 [Marasmius tenuissimus]